MEKKSPSETIAAFLEQLKENTLPGVWSKGVQFSRLLKGIELQSGENERELKFKMLTTERTLAFQVTLWPEEADSYCNCGSKIEPCHHIVAAALAYQSGRIDQSTDTKQPRLIYTWVIQADTQEIGLKREFFTGNNTLPVQPSLISMISGIQSGRLKLPLPPTGSADLKIDECLGKSEVSWPTLLKTLKEVPQIQVQGLDGITALEINPQPKKVELIIEDAPNGVLVSTLSLPQADFSFKQGLEIRGNTLELKPALRSPDLSMTILETDLNSFVLNTLPGLLENYAVTIETGKLPEIIEPDPTIEFKIHPLQDGTLSVTPALTYGDIPPGKALKRNPKKEQALGQELRQKYEMNLNQPLKLSGEEAFRLRAKFQHPALDQFLTRLIEDVSGLTLEKALSKPDAIQQLLALKKDSKSRKTVARHLEQTLVSASAPSNLQIPAKVSKSLWEKLRDYQKTGVAWLAERQESSEGAILADDMGLGKTVQTLAVLQSPSLVIAPTSLLHNWKTEAKRFRPDLKVQVFHGSDRTWDETADLTLTTYGLLRQETERLSQTDWQTAVLDEAHLIRNAETQIATAAHRLRAHFKIALTGTPIQNRQSDLVSLFQFVAPEFLENQTSLNPFWIKAFLLRRTKAEVLTELPPKTYLEHQIELTEKERETYQAVWAAAKKEIVEKLDGNKTNPLTLFEVLLRSRQFCNHPGLVDPARWTEESSKLTELLELIEELFEAGHSVLIYSQWTRFLDRIELSLEQKSMEWLRLDGSTRDRASVLEKFQTSEKPQVFLLSLHAGGVGLNLTKADHVVFCDPWWNPYVEIQAEDRAYRMGQDKPVTIHRLSCAQTIEEKIRDLQLEKMQLEKDYLKEGASFSLNMADLESLLRD